MIKVNYCGITWIVYPPLSQIYLENSDVDLYDFLDEATVRTILRKANDN